MQFFVPTGKQNVLTMTVVVGAVVNVALNAVLIPFLASVGAAIASIIAELCVTTVGLIYIRRKQLYEIKPIFTCSWKYWVAGVVMFGVVIGVKYILPTAAWALIVLILLGVVVYFLMLLVLRDNMLLEFITKFFNVIKQKFLRTEIKAQTETRDVEKRDEPNGENRGNVEQWSHEQECVQVLNNDCKNENEDNIGHEI